MNDLVSSLEELAEEIRREHQACLSSMRQGMEHAMKVGELLVQARRQMKHGDWEDWVTVNCNFTPRHARNYMSLSVHQEYLKTETISEMTLTGALETVRQELHGKLVEELSKQAHAGVMEEIRQFEVERAVRWKLENEHQQVKTYLDALKVFVQAVRDVVPAAEFGKFSPEGARFTMRRHDALRQELERLEEVFRQKQEGKEGKNV